MSILVAVMLCGMIPSLRRSNKTDKESWTQNDTLYPTRRVDISFACVGIPHKAIDFQGFSSSEKDCEAILSGLARLRVAYTRYRCMRDVRCVPLFFKRASIIRSIYGEALVGGIQISSRNGM